MDGKARLRFRTGRSKEILCLGVFGLLVFSVLNQGALASSRICGGYGHTIVLQTDGTVWAWGDNSRGQLGDGTAISRLLPVQVANLSEAVAVKACLSHSLALKADGTVWAWGDNSFGQLGDGTNTTRFLPVQVAGLADVVAIATGMWHSLALKADGTVWAWGDNSRGQLGDGTAISRLLPVQVNSLAQVIALTSGLGARHSIALKSDGTVWAWGNNSYGQLGDGTTILRSLPVHVSSVSDVVSIALGSDFSLALKADGTVWAWGSNQYGQLGDGTAALRKLPGQVSSISSAVSISSGYIYSLALNADGTVWAWGGNQNGQLGDGTTELKRLPVLVGGASRVISIGSGHAHSLALKADGTVWAWGLNDRGQVGNGIAGVFKGFPTLSLFVLDPKGYTKISGGMLHSLALKNGAGGTVYSWGYNTRGQLGDGTTLERSTPGFIDNLNNVKALGNCSQGYQSVILKSDGTVWAWGNNHYGQLGDGNSGTDVISTNPVQTINLSNVAAVATGVRHSLAVRADGTVWTWGINEHGNLGDGTTNDRPVPGLVPGLSGIKAVAAGGDGHSLALRADGTVWAWGDIQVWSELPGPDCGPDKFLPEQIGGLMNIIAISAGKCNLALKADGTVWEWGKGYYDDGTAANYCSPVQVHGGSSFNNIVAISAGSEHCLALKADGTVWAWGDNHFGQLGDVAGDVVPTPYPVLALDGIIAIAAGGSHSLALKADGSILAWGDNYGGQTGDGTNRNTRCTPGLVLPDDCTSPVSTGTNIVVNPKDPVSGENSVTVTFSSVTQEGSVFATSSPGAMSLPMNFRLAEPFLSYYVTTTAQYDGYVAVCINFEEPAPWFEPSLRLLHYWDAEKNAGKLPGIDPNFDYSQSGWEDATISLDVTNNIICGTVTALSPFMIGLPMEITAPTAPIQDNTPIIVSVPYGNEGFSLWDFGDGPVGQGMISEDGTRWLAEHLYTSPGVYEISLQLWSDGVSVGTAEYQYVVVYDPSAGFVTGGGWINSPLGAYSANPALTGKANFGFVSKYQKGATTPTGATEFQFKAGGMNFFSSSYDWLVIAGAKAQFKGTGTINGAGSYKFMLTGIDADINLADSFTVDRFRIRIWTEDEFGNENVVYDNALGDDSDLATTAIGGGSIMIHKK